MEHNTNDNSQMINPFHHRLINRPSARGWMVLCWMTLSWLVLLGLAVPVWAGPAPEPIDICSYDSKTLGDLQALVEARGLGKTLPELAPALSDDPDQLLTEWEQPGMRINEDIHEKSGMPIGYIHLHHVICPQGSGNQNMWVFDVLENEAGIIERVNTQLLYNDQNFALRDERINTERYLSKDGVISAVASLMEAHSYSREQIRQEMIAGGFWLNRSCETAQTVTDTFVAPPFPPNSVFYIMGYYSIPGPYLRASISFSRPSEKFLNVKLSYGKNGSDCGYDQELYSQQSGDFFLENYPESWVTQKIRNKRIEEGGKNNITFLKSLNPTGGGTGLAPGSTQDVAGPTSQIPAITAIDLCSYDAQSLDDLTALVQAKGVGKTLPELAPLLSDDPANTLAYWNANSRPVDQGIQKITGITAGRIYRFVRSCQQEFDNQNIWSFHILENAAGRVEIIDPYLFYDHDQNFVMRREAINAQRYATPEGVVQAIASMMKAHSYSRERLREEMTAGGFWLSGSCKTIKMLRDNFITPPAPPESLIALNGYSWLVHMHPHAAVIFSRSSGEWMKAQPFPNVDHRECRFDRETMQRRIRVFFKENYPDSWAASKYVQTPVMKNRPNP